MAVFNNSQFTAGQLFQAENMTFGEVPRTDADLKRQIDDLKTLLDGTHELPEETRAPVAAALDEARAVPADEPGAKQRVVTKLEGARGFLEAATGVAKQAAPLVGAIGAVIGAVSGLIG